MTSKVSEVISAAIVVGKLDDEIRKSTDEGEKTVLREKKRNAVRTLCKAVKGMNAMQITSHTIPEHER